MQALLDELNLSTYVFAVEPRADHWEVRVEFSPNSAWRPTVLEAGAESLAACRHDQAVRERLLAQWRARLRTR